MAKTIKLPLFVFISKLWETHKQKQDELTQVKMKFLENEAFKCFYEQYLIMHTNRIGNKLDLHPSYYAKRDAHAKAQEIVLNVLKRGRINQCYRARIIELKKMGVL